jgi:hypothetical protein
MLEASRSLVFVNGKRDGALLVGGEWLPHPPPAGRAEDFHASVAVRQAFLAERLDLTGRFGDFKSMVHQKIFGRRAHWTGTESPASARTASRTPASVADRRGVVSSATCSPTDVTFDDPMFHCLSVSKGRRRAGSTTWGFRRGRVGAVVELAAVPMPFGLLELFGGSRPVLAVGGKPSANLNSKARQPCQMDVCTYAPIACGTTDSPSSTAAPDTPS